MKRDYCFPKKKFRRREIELPVNRRIQPTAISQQVYDGALIKVFNSSPIATCISLLAENRFIFTNKAFLDLVGYPADEVLNCTWEELPVWCRTDDKRKFYQLLGSRKPVQNTEIRLQKKDGQVIEVLASIELIEFDGRNCCLVMLVDISERKGVESVSKETNQKLEALIKASPLAIVTLDLNHHVTLWNESAGRIFGWPAEEVLGKSLPILPSDEQDEFTSVIAEIQRGVTVTDVHVRPQRKDGEWIDINLSTAALKDADDRISGYMWVMADTTSHNRGEQIRNAVYQVAQATNSTENLQELYYSIHQVLGTLMPVQNFFIALYDPATDMISYPYFVDENDAPPPPQKLGHGLTGYVFRSGKPILASPEVFNDLVSRGEVEIMGADSIDWLGVPLIVKNESIGVLAVQSYTPGIRFTDEELEILSFVSSQIAMAIERKRSEEVMRVNESRYRAIVEDQTDLICRYLPDGTLTFVNDALCKQYGLSPETAIGHSYFPLLPTAEIERSKKYLAMLTPEHPLGSIEHYMLSATGDVHWYQWTDRALYDENGQFIEFQSVGRDITEQKRRQQEIEIIASLTTALRSARTRAEMIPVILEQLTSLLAVDGVLLASYDPFKAEIAVDMGRGGWEKEGGKRFPINYGITGQVIETREVFTNANAQDENGLSDFEKWPSLQSIACVALIAHESPVGALWIGKNSIITGDEIHLLTVIADLIANTIYRATLHEQTQQRLQRLTVLRSIDMAITSSLDLNVTLNILIDQVISQLGINAADLLLLDRYTQQMSYAASQGFRTAQTRKKRLRLGEGPAGQVARDRRPIIIPDLSDTKEPFAPDTQALEESFKAYLAVPLISKGQVKGVLELFQRSVFSPDSEWLEFLQSLAAQAAIAIDNAELLEGLQQSNSELSQAYDATIEGWSRASEAREQETEGHTHQLAELTLMLVQFMGLSGVELEQMRWGILLHDIGKMVIPDQILFKPGPLDEDEWKIMHLHPVYAKDLLSAIPYLRRAIDIPYYHHEKWDGSGYPRGIVGEQIPLSARIFAVVDVWDALISERPFRKGWTKEKTRQYIQSQSGKSFDPTIAEAFLRFEQNGFFSH